MGENIDKAKGRIKQATGVLTGNKKLKREGEMDELKGKAKGKIKDLKKAEKSLKKAVRKEEKK